MNRLMSAIDGFIVPGAMDSFDSVPHHRSAPFNLEQIDESRMEDHETFYQNVYDYSIKKGIPVMGTCAGNQHLALHHGGLSVLLSPRFFWVQTSQADRR